MGFEGFLESLGALAEINSLVGVCFTGRQSKDPAPCEADFLPPSKPPIVWGVSKPTLLD